MRFRDLPGFPPLFVDLAEGAERIREFFPHRLETGTLRACAELARDSVSSRDELCNELSAQAAHFGSGGPALANIDRLRSPGSVAVTATMRPGLLGGPLWSWLKLMTAARLAAWLTEGGVPAVPVAWMDARPFPDDLCAGVLSHNGPEIVGLDGFPDPAGALPATIRRVLAQVAGLMENGVGGSLAILESTYLAGSKPGDAWARAVAKFLDPCGIVLCNPSRFAAKIPGLASKSFPQAQVIMTLRLEQENRLKAAGYETPDQRSALIYEYDQDDGEVLTTMTPFFIQSLLLPVAAFVVEESEVYAAGREQQLFSKHRSFTPVVWLRSSATLVDVRSRKMLDRYHLGVETLFAGAERVADAMKRIHPPGDPAARVSGMKGVIEAKLSDLTRLVRSGDRLSKAVNDSRRRMMHQIEKLPAGFASAQERRNEIIGRRANHLCTHLAPWGKLQERALAGFQFNLPSAGLLYQSIDPWKFEHQLIPL